MKFVNIHCDGACLENGKPNASGGYGVVVEEAGVVTHSFFGKLRAGVQTNNRAELEAMLQTLNYISVSDKSNEYMIYSDSTTVVDGILGTAKRKANRDIWEEIEKICNVLNTQGYKIGVKHCNKEDLDPSDVCYDMNVQADLLAFRGANALIIC